jgi:hypothetical protein
MIKKSLKSKRSKSHTWAPLSPSFLCIPLFLVRLYIAKRTNTYLHGVVTVQHGAAVVETVTDPPPRKKFLKIFRFSLKTQSRGYKHCYDAIQIRIRIPIPIFVPIRIGPGSRSGSYSKIN